MNRMTTRRRLQLALLAVVVGLVAVAPRVVTADDLAQTSLNKAPANASFYMASLQMRQLYDKVTTSKAYAQFMSIPSVQLGLAMAMQQWNEPSNPNVANLKAMLEDPANQQLVELIKDAVSHEVFVYGDASVVDALDVVTGVSDAVNGAQMDALQSGDVESLPQYQLRAVIAELEKQGDKVKVPTIVKGMKLSDTQPALDQMKRLEGLVQQALAQQPALQPRFVREQIGGGEFLTFKLDGTLIPWPLIMQGAQGVDQADMQKLVEKVSALKLVISLGVKDDYLLVSLGADNAHLATLGQGDTLLNSPRMEPVRKAADKPITGVSFASGALLNRVASVDRQMDQMVNLVKTVAPMALQGAQELQEELFADAEKFAEYVKAKVPKQGDVTSFSYLTPAGYESFSYNWAINPAVDASQELTILSHVGGNPILFVAARGKSDPQEYDDIAAGLSRLTYYAEQIAAQQLPPDKLAVVDSLKQKFMPLFKQLGEATRNKLIPGFADGQSALVLDAQTKSPVWHQLMPPSEQPLPMLELGLVMGVSDKNLVKEGFAEYFDVAQKAIDVLHEASTGDLKELFPQPIPPIKLADPDTRDVAGGTIYYYKVDESAGLDARLAPNAGLTDKVMVASLLPQFTARLMEDTPLQASGPLADHQRPLANAFQVNFAGLLSAISPWIDYVMDLNGGMEESPVGNIKQQVQQVLQVLSCFRGVSGVTYQEGDAMVTHAQWLFEDLD